MGWKILRFRIKMPEVRAPRMPAKAHPLPKAPSGTGAGARLKSFDLTVFSQKGVTPIDIIRALIASNGNRTKAAANLGVTSTNVINRAKRIRQLPEAQLQIYAEQLNTTLDKIKKVCADINPQKDVTHIDVIKALIETRGNRRKTGEKLGISGSVVSKHAKNIRKLTDAQLQKYAKQLNTTVAKIRKVCADLDSRKNITHIDVVKALTFSGGDRTMAAKKLGIAATNVSKYAKNIRGLPDTQLQIYAGQLCTTVDKIRSVCAGINPQKGVTHIDVIKALIETRGNRWQSGKKLGIGGSVVGEHAKNIRGLTDAQLQKYAKQLNTTVAQIRTVCADLTRTKNINQVVIIRVLLAVGGDRAQASKKLGVTSHIISYHAKKIRGLSDTQLQKYADQFNTTVAQIREICADLDSTKNITHIDVITALTSSGGDRTMAAKKLGIAATNVSKYAKNIRGLPDAQLQIYANQLNITVARIKTVCADITPQKDITHIDVIKALLVFCGNRKQAAEILGVRDSGIGVHAKNIRRLPAVELQKYASWLTNELGEKVTMGDILDVVSPRGKSKIDFERRKQVIQALLAADGNRTKSAEKLKITPYSVSYHAKNIRELPDSQLQIYAAEFNTTVAQIRTVCADLSRIKGITHIKVIKALLITGGRRSIAAAKLKINTGAVSLYAKNIRGLPDPQLQIYADQLGTTVERIKKVCASHINQAKRKLFKK